MSVSLISEYTAIAATIFPYAPNSEAIVIFYLPWFGFLEGSLDLVSYTHANSEQQQQEGSCLSKAG